MTSPPSPCLPARRQNSRQAGFTLLEVLLAIFMFAMVMSILYVTLGKSMTLINRAEQQAEIYAMARTALLRIQEDLEAIPLMPPLTQPDAETIDKRQFILKDSTEDGRDNDTLMFVSLADIPARGKSKTPAYGTAITYHTEKNSDSTMTLYRTASPLGREPQPSAGDRAILCELLLGVDFHCADDHGKEHSAWDSDANPDAGLPQRITVTLRFHDPTVASGETRFMTSFLLPVNVQR